ncbi:activating transcription factor 7-interacting protein 1-like [Saccostrea echinata]|uniref:activating transcription factor 7-interacting protein 1-like n=1 Tax=Saccostrea echinata TaxID=191078 RepID=UPI002A8038D3|nr:activating transcription factor 7-interacting protein 1-like [Saccostrea echinata]
MNSSTTSEGCDTPYLNMNSLNGQCAIEKTQMNGQNNVHNDQNVIKESPPTRKEDYTSDMGIFNRKNGPPFDGTPINLLDDRSFVINDKMRSSFRDIMNKMSENTPTLGNLLAKTKYTGLNTKDTKSSIIINAPPPPTTTSAPSVSGGQSKASAGNLFDKMQEMQNSTTTIEKTTECNKDNSLVNVEAEIKAKCDEVIELDDSIEEKETKSDFPIHSNDLKVDASEKKSENDLLEITSDSEDEEKKKLNEEARNENDMKPEEEDKLLASDEDTQQSGVSVKSNQSQESISKDSQDSVNCDKNLVSENGKDVEDASEKMEVEEEDEEESASESESSSSEKKQKSEVSENTTTSEDSKSSEDSNNLDSKDVHEEKEVNDKKRPADFSDALPYEPKRSRLDMVIGKLGSQIGIAPESLKDEEMSDTDTANESTPTPTEDTEDEDEELHRKKKKPPVRLSEKVLEKMVKTKVLNHLKNQKEGLVAELQQKVEELQASNDMWKQRVKDLEKQILEVTVLQQKHEKRKAKTAALRQITTKSVGVQVDSQKAAAIVQIQQTQQTTPVKSPSSKPVTKTATTNCTTPPTSTSKPGPTLTISKFTPSSPQLAPPKSTLNPVTNIPVLKSQTPTQMQTTLSSQSTPTVALPSTADGNKGPFPSNQTVKTILDNTRGSLQQSPGNQTVKNILDSSRGLVSQPISNSRVRPVRAVTPGVQSTTLLSPTIAPNQMTSYIVVPTPAPLPNTKPNVTVVSAPVVNQPTLTSQQQAQLNQQVQPKSVKVIDLTMEEEANRNLANRGVAISMSQSQVLVPTGTGLPQGLILSNPAGSSIIRNGQQQPAYQFVFSSTSKALPQGSILTLATPIPSPGMRPAVAGTSMVAATSSAITAMPQLRPGQATTTPPSSKQSASVAAPVQQRPPPPLQYGAQSTNRMANTSLSTVAPPPLSAQHPAPLPPVTSVVTSGQKPLPPKPSLKISRVSQGIVLSWNMTLNETPHADIASYQLFAYQEGNTPPSTALWKKVGDVKALPLPMACTLTQFQEGNKYHFAVRPVDVLGRNGHFSDPNSIHLLPNKKD